MTGQRIDPDVCPECGLSITALGPDGEPWHEGGVCPGPPCPCGSGWPVIECNGDAEGAAREF